MIFIKILVIGKLKEKSWNDLSQEYLKRLKPYAKIEIIELKPEPFNKSNIKEAIKKESQKIKEHLEKEKNSTIFILDERGKSLNSQEFSVNLERVSGSIIFVVNGALGYDREILKNYNLISLSPLTFPHEMARVVLLEQIYRAITIINQKEYHY